MGRGSIIEPEGRSFFFLHSSLVILRRKENASIFHDDVRRPVYSRGLFGIDFPRYQLCYRIIRSSKGLLPLTTRPFSDGQQALRIEGERLMRDGDDD